jgi:hypothetical protein
MIDRNLMGDDVPLSQQSRSAEISLEGTRKGSWPRPVAPPNRITQMEIRCVSPTRVEVHIRSACLPHREIFGFPHMELAIGFCHRIWLRRE